MVLRPVQILTIPAPMSLAELDDRHVLFIGQIISKFRIHNCINTYITPGRQSTSSLKYFFTVNELANETHTQYHKQSMALLEDGILRFTEVQDACLNKSLTTVSCIQSNTYTPLTRWYYDPDEYQLKTEGLCLTFNSQRPTDYLNLTPCNNPSNP